VSIDPGAATPLWRQLADILRAQIESGELPAGRIVPSETTLSQQHGLARGTVVKALDALEREGLVERIQGRGTFVRRDRPAAGKG
jgi:DNA-binding GntR family transcriptional regulator